MRVFTVSEITTACRVLEALAQGVAIVEGVDSEDEIIETATRASITALKIIDRGLAEIIAEHARSNGPQQ